MPGLEKFFNFSQKDNCVYFTGEKLEIFVPMRYQAKNYLKIGNNIQALGVFAMRVNDTIEGGLQLPAVITFDPVDAYVETIDEQQYYTCILRKGGKLMTTLDVMQDNKVGYFLWTEFLALGNHPRFFTYDNSITLLDDIKAYTGKGLPVDHALFEIVIAHLFRDSDDLSIHYRHTDMRKPPAHVTLRDVGYGTSSTHSRILGSYADTGRTAALLQEEKESGTLENLFRA